MVAAPVGKVMKDSGGEKDIEDQKGFLLFL